MIDFIFYTSMPLTAILILYLLASLVDYQRGDMKFKNLIMVAVALIVSIVLNIISFALIL